MNCIVEAIACRSSKEATGNEKKKIGVLRRKYFSGFYNV